MAESEVTYDRPENVADDKKFGLVETGVCRPLLHIRMNNDDISATLALRAPRLSRDYCYDFRQPIRDTTVLGYG